MSNRSERLFGQGAVTMVLAILVTLVASVCSHGYLARPVARSSAWRMDFPTPRNNDDNGLNCGGYSNQFETNGGKCGLCGDPYQEPQPRRNEGGGLYGVGQVVERYSQGAVIDVKVVITANHKGSFTFQLCPTNNPTKPANETCFNNHQLRLSNGDSSYVLRSGISVVNLKVKLPDDVSCPQGCVFRWKWRAGNNWGCEDGRCAVGRGKQEHFYGCSDVVVTPANDDPRITEHTPTTSRVTSLPTKTSGTTVSLSTKPKSSDCSACQAKPWYPVPGMRWWCEANCFHRLFTGKDYGVDIYCDCPVR